ncbi:MAG: hypothetical protein JW910_07730 [Anaerolineae bacterium]|nr:hypothetical protein [Anaerolineae bacterium]
MNWQALLGLTVVFFILMLIVQRTEAKRRRIVFVVVLAAGELVRRYLWYRGWPTEGGIAFITALVLNGLFWLFIGQQNPPGSSDEIEVVGNE